MNIKLSQQEETDIIDYIENQRPQSIPDLNQRIEELYQAARNKVMKNVVSYFEVLY